MPWIKVIVFTWGHLYANPKAEKKKRKKTGICYYGMDVMLLPNYKHRLNEKEDEEREILYMNHYRDFGIVLLQFHPDL